MKVLLTGWNGTLAPHVATELRRLGHEAVAFDRARCSPDDAVAVDAYLAEHSPQAVMHLGFGSEAFAAQLALWCGERGLPMLFTSTAMVFDHEPNGPHLATHERNAKDDYGRYKARCEDAVLHAHAGACVARLGWQIHIGAGASAFGNNMLAALDAEFARTGQVRASTAWVPACSFMEDSATALVALLQSGAAGAHHVDANAQAAWSFERIVCGLAAKAGRSWQVVAHDEYRHDQRLSASVPIVGIDERLGL